MVCVGCGSPRGPAGPVVSPTGIVYEPGTPPTETRRSQTAVQYLRQDRADRAVELALEGIAEDPGNPIHHYLAGVAYARLGEYERADSMFDEAERLYPAYELDIEPEREAAWGEAFNAGLALYDDGDVEGTIEVWRQGTVLYDLRPEAHRNLARLLMAESRFPEAIDIYLGALAGLERRPATSVLGEEELEARARARTEIEDDLGQLFLATSRFAEAEPLLRAQLARDPENIELMAALAASLSGQGKDDEAQVIYERLLSEEGLATTELFNLGVGLFRTGEYEQAALAFKRLTEVQPDSRDAWFNYANSLFAAEAWDSLAVAGARLVAMDPLGENAHLITARARLETGDRAGALASLAGADDAPVHVAGLQMQRAGAVTTVYGRVTGNIAAPADPIRLRFVFYGEGGQQVGASELTLAAPAPTETEPFEVRFDGTALAYRYEVLP